MTIAQTPNITPGDSLVTEGIPPIPVNIAQTVDRYTNFRAASLSSWHPTRREMLITTRFADTPQVHLVKTPLGTRKQMTFFTERVPGGSFQPTQGDYFVFSKDIGGNEFAQNYRYDLATAEVTLLTDGKSKNSRGVWSNKGDKIIYTSTRRTGKDNDLYIIDPRNPQSDKLLAQVEGGGWSPLDWSPDDTQIVTLEFVSANESYLYLLDPVSGNKKIITPKNGKEKIFYGAAVFSKDGKGLYVITDKGSEFSRLAYIDFSSMKYDYLTSNIPWNVEDIDLSKDGKHLAFVTNEDGASILRIIDTATRKPLSLPKLPIGQVAGISWHKNNEDLGFTLVSARSTPDVYSLNIRTNKVERWTESETGGLNTEGFVDAQLVRWKSFDGKTISGFLYLPPKKFQGKRPVIIDIHGGPEAQSRPGFLGRNNYYLNELGVAMLYPNVRGSAGYGKTFLQLDNEFKREDSVRDIGALLDWIATQPNLDKDRVMVTGGSYGGYMSLAVATKYSSRIRAAIDIVGISNFVTFLEKTEGYRRDLRRVEYGDERDPKMREFLLKISPVNNAQNIKKPLFVVHGANDPRVPLNEAQQIVATVKKNNVPVWYLTAKDEGHGFSKKKNIDYLFYATVMYVKQYLLN
ncbi:S9 family peptidase [Aetokthonos hydrillicola Thurmond2011]|uniref:S9 family peptidase n=1 Tax=Aetokthonos hydrillicola Thurmond2011 TaxID=2712845 RepID=A0AAP5MCH3_9CYAN|nr:S9 family peptidase [Aetokthonos hydrillicola]MBO3460326.1 S9 family peptidase [Aetokthonos hydrillicola CCALA 1050]MBW4590779.1 S9 family peptidase [Aetokthonos hydrillicola CCALA 1050]MDR9898039.1 S9 family peptidase [Aetokthonos hydrillicola Thurmond2011]